VTEVVKIAQVVTRFIRVVRVVISIVGCRQCTSGSLFWLKRTQQTPLAMIAQQSPR
jgi:hypothetical protein